MYPIIKVRKKKFSKEREKEIFVCLFAAGK